MSTTLEQITKSALRLTGHTLPTVTKTTTASTAVNAALRLLDKTSADGTISTTRQAKYLASAISFVNAIQIEIMQRENPVASVTTIDDLDDTLSISDESALNVMPAGIAMKFAMEDHENDIFNAMSSEYYSKLSAVRKIASGDTNQYYQLALANGDALQLELLKREGYTGPVPDPFTDITDYLTVSDETARRVMVYGLAAQFALQDGNTALNTRLTNKYTAESQKIMPEQTPAEDATGFFNDPDLFN